ncbi:adenosylcobinamide-phosphate synthase CbiB [Paracoccus aestuariivivens]|uniref:Cobalamin biosynthesis protein CobD n=1 Tax=Paracoccus aestuariivivens TaxID=1820333 RepID=A0A6L6JG93_9RHOB|nr:adenosylcobinamide-phosphate synthase CbiB [Paracoccus aestuariivivens]MTH79759.1 cobalamin biosynthesis protein CobD [Paracoccus aestuariivivens]
MNYAAMMLVALALDAAIGWPAWLYRRVGHPVTWLGNLISTLEVRLNRHGPSAFVTGAVTVIAVTTAALLPAMTLQLVLPSGWIGTLIGGALAWPLIAARSLHDHVVAVARPLATGDIAGARRSVGMIVGRDPRQLDQGGVARAALESLAENNSDGVVAPIFWGVVAGLPGIAVYKAVNTMDSMIGHRNPRYEYFGKVAARLDDLMNLIPARLTGVLHVLASGRPVRAFRVMRSDARHHRSPNAGWPEAAIAGALDVRLSGPRVYAEHIADEPWLNGTARDPEPADLARGLALYRQSILICAAGLAFLAII